MGLNWHIAEKIFFEIHPGLSKPYKVVLFSSTKIISCCKQNCGNFCSKRCRVNLKWKNTLSWRQEERNKKYPLERKDPVRISNWPVRKSHETPDTKNRKNKICTVCFLKTIKLSPKLFLIYCNNQNMIFTSVFNCFQGLSILSLLVGAYHAIKDRQENNKENYYFGNGSMSPVSHISHDTAWFIYLCKTFFLEAMMS